MSELLERVLKQICAGWAGRNFPPWIYLKKADWEALEKEVLEINLSGGGNSNFIDENAAENGYKNFILCGSAICLDE